MNSILDQISELFASMGDIIPEMTMDKLKVLLTKAREEYQKDVLEWLSQDGQCTEEHHWEGRKCPNMTENCTICAPVKWSWETDA